MTCTSCTPRRTPTSRSSKLAERPPGVREVRGTNFCRIAVRRRPPRRPRARLRGDRQPLEGDLVAGGAEPQPDVRLRRGRRGSRRERGRSSARAGSPRPAHVRELDGGLPGGLPRRRRRVRAQARRALDLGLLVCDAPETTSAARFTRSGVAAAPVELCRERCDLAHLRAVVANSGNANAATGVPRSRDRRRDADRRLAARPALDAGRRRDRLDRRDRRAAARRSRARRDRPRRTSSCAPTATRTSPTRSGRPTRSPSARRCASSCPPATVRLSAQAKGAGMIPPSFATMLCFVRDRRRARPRRSADLLLGVTVKRSFDRISVDGQLSTNDTAVLIGERRQRRARGSRSRRTSSRFGEALDALLRQLALMIVADGEGGDAGRARRRARRRRRARSSAAARAVANSPLVKAALHGGDPNWGRIVQAVGGVLLDARRSRSTSRSRACRCARDGAALALRRARARGRRSRGDGGRVLTARRCPATAPRPRSSSPTSSHEYVTINADYTT